jgi:hypothetical protein
MATDWKDAAMSAATWLRSAGGRAAGDQSGQAGLSAQRASGKRNPRTRGLLGGFCSRLGTQESARRLALGGRCVRPTRAGESPTRLPPTPTRPPPPPAPPLPRPPPGCPSGGSSRSMQRRTPVFSPANEKSQLACRCIGTGSA